MDQLFKIYKSPFFWLYLGISNLIFLEILFSKLGFFYLPILEITLVTLPFLVFVHKNPTFHFPFPSKKFLFSLRRKQAPIIVQPVIEAHPPSNKSAPIKQLSLSEKPNINQFERNLHTKLMSQLSRSNQETLHLQAPTTSGIEKYPLSYEQILGSINVPSNRYALNVFCWPVFSHPQKKIRFYNCEPGIFIGQDKKEYAQLNLLDARPSRGAGGIISFIVLLRVLSRVREELLPLSRVPVIVDLPGGILDYPKLVEYFLDYLEHPDFPIQKVIWRISEGMLASHNAGVVEKIEDLGGAIICVLNYPRIDKRWPYLQINHTTLENISSQEAYKNSPLNWEQFGAQTGEIILGYLNKSEAPQIPYAFDCAFGEALEPFVLLENLTPTRNIFSSQHQTKSA
jgi:hypothetical protein